MFKHYIFNSFISFGVFIILKYESEAVNMLPEIGNHASKSDKNTQEMNTIVCMNVASNRLQHSIV